MLISRVSFREMAMNLWIKQLVLVVLLAGASLNLQAQDWGHDDDLLLLLSGVLNARGSSPEKPPDFKCKERWLSLNCDYGGTSYIWAFVDKKEKVTGSRFIADDKSYEPDRDFQPHHCEASSIEQAEVKFGDLPSVVQNEIKKSPEYNSKQVVIRSMKVIGGSDRFEAFGFVVYCESNS